MPMRRAVGVLAEVYSKWERRSPLTPEHVKRLVVSGIECLIQPSPKRVFTDREYLAAGAKLTHDLSTATTVSANRTRATCSACALLFLHLKVQ